MTVGGEDSAEGLPWRFGKDAKVLLLLAVEEDLGVHNRNRRFVDTS